MARTSRVLISVVIVAAIGVGAYVLRDSWLGPAERMLGVGQAANTQQASGTRGGGRRRGAAQSTGPTAVLTAVAKATDVPVYIDGVGSVKPLNTVTVRPQVSGELVEIHFEEGQDIKKGDVIARIDDAVYKATLDQAVGKKAQDQALLQSAQNDFERYQRLLQSNSGTQQQVDTAKFQVAQYQAQVQSDQAAIESAQATLDYTTIKAPIDGRTGIRNVDIGNIVSSTDTTGIVTLSQIRPISVVFSVPQQQLAKVNAANAAGTLSVQALAGGDQAVVDTGTLAVVDNQVDVTTGTVKLKANFPNEKLALWPGAFVNARLLIETMKGVIVVPTAAVQRGPNGTFAYLLQPDQTVLMKPIRVGQQDDVQAVITDGIAAGDIVVTTGFARLQTGSKVEVSDPSKPAVDKPATTTGADGKPHRHHNSDGGDKPANDGAAPANPPAATQ
ncbi:MULTISPECIES: efflux RND transporter periplasmic adaptor subunit [unclassified Rhizobium]|uniref:Efflux RND transporter periplasmic adaptor subunit n=1 Tax=Rhizobium rhododendri TaxID=2506430 RepID=A0ABY8IGI6_9HYPH|nr:MULTISPECIES: efflux RND transporter periplasmic adaptor subunit [unclassified Rhizobium]WFS22718.1 efflux RND transporter periplasmic adaptor subunit [Rhizobium rhododendri]MBZ5762187.1 efflux RND transporter periplasmic adaptor subunit [Rhizobium sp. VS19-DR96]MBZ5767648.1 efflux RND transporter periplasmic adaptor subunit [Rhizobium sp. VS19-DR129.2]MBZ5775445.1 efflux RND transporter periplasmic adaptor subunit [Rhizobium sp. VS19-DRK62.2]MBZ5786132.1 efflux RND transporter periplasmic 